jgi:hypothetical protein
MRTDYAVLRILVLVGFLPLVVRDAGVLTVRGNYPNVQCRPQVGPTQLNCPAPCNPGTYTTYQMGNNSGFYDYTINATPCSPSTCAQPEAYSAPIMAQCKEPPCCLSTTSVCATGECGGADPCCGSANCVNGLCCLANGLSCSGSNECCSGLCGTSEACCSITQLGVGSCQFASDCCGTAVGCQNNVCCGDQGHTCSAGQCCSGYTCLNGTCVSCGGNGEPCCESGQQCSQYTCVDGYCHPPSPIIIDVDGFGISPYGLCRGREVRYPQHRAADPG